MLCQLAAVNWDALFNTANMPFVMVFGIVTVVSVAGIFGGVWQKSKKYEHETKLKRDLVAKGYSAEEIERIVQAKFKG